MTTLDEASSSLNAAHDTARTSGVDTATALRALVAIAPMVFGGQVVHRPSARAKVGGVVIVGFGVLFALGG